MSSAVRLVLAAATVAGLLAAGCADGGRDAPVVVVRDSAGVTIVENGPLEALPTFEADPDAIVGVGVLEGDPNLQLHRVRGGLVTPGGGLVVLNAGSAEVRWYDAEGRFQRAQGRPGEGPGEYGSPDQIFVYRGDSLAVWDDRLRRLTVLGPDGSYARDLTPTGDLARATVLGAFPDGTFAVLDRRFDGQESNDYQDLPGPTLLYDASGAPTGDTLSVDAWLTARFQSPGQGIVELRGRGLDQAPSRAITAEALWVGDPDAGELRRHAPGSAGPSHIVRWPLGDRAVTDEVITAHTQDRLDAAPNDEVRQAIRRAAEVQEYAERLPALRTIATSDDGHLWVEAFPRPGEAREPTWWIFDGEGRAHRTVVLPPNSEPLWAEGDRVLLLLRDDLGVERVELRRLVPSARGG